MSRKYNKSGILHEAKDWVMKIDVDQQLRFPQDICISTLMCPAEENIEERHSEKTSRYEGLLKDCNNAGWKVHQFAIKLVHVGMQLACSDVFQD